MSPIPPLVAAASNEFLPLLALTLLLTVGVALLLRRLRFPALPGFFLCGYLLSRTGTIDLAEGSQAASLLIQMGDVGVLLLMFSIGTECSLHELRLLRANGLKSGAYQVILTTLCFTFVAWVCGQGAASLIWGLIAAISSTAVGIKLFEDSGHAGHPGARQALGIALTQDLVVIVALLLLPGLSGPGGANAATRATLLLGAEGIIFIAASALLSRWGIPQILQAVSRTRARDLFTLTALALCAGIASLAQFLDLGVNVGAFAAGVAVSGSVYSHRILADAAPFRDFFLTIFFLSVGALVNPVILRENWLLILSLSTLALLAKTGLTTLAARMAGAKLPDALLAAVALSGLGEFAIVLGRKAVDSSLLTNYHYQLILAVTAVSLSLSPLLMKFAGPLAEKLAARPSKAGPQKKQKAASLSRRVKEMEDHAILCGYGTVGQMLHRGLTRLGIPVIVIELNADTVAGLLAKGHPVLYADISQADTLELAGITRARMIVLSFPHAEVARAAITIARERNPAILTLCRARFPHEAAMLRELDPDNVVHDEYEAGVRMLRLCARGYGREESEFLQSVPIR